MFLEKSGVGNQADFLGVVLNVAQSSGNGDIIDKSLFVFGLTAKGLEQFNKGNLKELQKLQAVLESNNNVNSINIQKLIGSKAGYIKWIKRAGVVGNVANGLSVTVKIANQGYATGEDIYDGIAAGVAFIPGGGWIVSTAMVVGKEGFKFHMKNMQILHDRGVSDFYLYSGYAGPKM